MVKVLYNIFRDLYIVLLVIFLIEQIPGSDLLHDVTRKGVLVATICIVVFKVVQPFFNNSGGGPRRGPRRQKKTEGGKTTYLDWASSEMQGWRPAMEDATCIVASLPPPLVNKALFAVFDGHGGAEVSQIASQEFPKVLGACAANILEQEAREREEAGANSKDAVPSAKSDEKALHLTMLTMDALLRKGTSSFNSSARGPLEIAREMEASVHRPQPFNLMGSTAIIVLVDCGDDGPLNGRPRRITVANCGDSRAILCHKGTAVELSEDHKPELPREEERIKKAGGHVALIGPCHRVDGWGLNLSRALGDFHYKANESLPPEEQKVIAVPEICTLDLSDEDEFLVLACDGVFELNTSQNVIDMVRKELQKGATPEKAAEHLLDQSCSENLMKTRGRGGDNCSAIVLKLKR